MRVGELKNLLTIQRKVQVGATSMNEPLMVWHDWRTDIWCGVFVKRGREHYDYMTKQRISEEVWQFRVRFDEVVGIDNSMQILHEGNVFDIKAIIPDGQNRDDCLIEAILRDGSLQSKPLSIWIGEAIPMGFAGAAYAGFTILSSGGEAPRVITATLPAGLSVNSSTGAVTGMPTAAGTFDVTATVTDANGFSETTPTFQIKVS